MSGSSSFSDIPITIRFGFSSEKARHLESPFRPEAFMAMELRSGALDGIRGRVGYPAAFGL